MMRASRGRGNTPLPDTKGSEEVDEMNVSEALLKAILELIEKCETLDELKESVRRIVGE